MTLGELHGADPLMHALLLESCSGRTALASMLCSRIGAIAADRTLAAERERVSGHIKLGQLGVMTIAIEAVESGASLSEMSERYMAAAKARRDEPLLQLVQQTGDQK